MLLADPPGGNDTPQGKCDGRAEDGFRYKDTFGMMAQCAVPKNSDDLLRFIEPAMNIEVVLDGAAPFFDAGP